MRHLPDRVSPSSPSSEFSRIAVTDQLFFFSSLTSPPSRSPGKSFFPFETLIESIKNPQKNPENPPEKKNSYLISSTSHCAVCGRFPLSLLPRSRLVAPSISSLLLLHCVPWSRYLVLDLLNLSVLWSFPLPLNPSLREPPLPPQKKAIPPSPLTLFSCRLCLFATFLSTDEDTKASPLKTHVAV